MQTAQQVYDDVHPVYTTALDESRYNNSLSVILLIYHAPLPVLCELNGVGCG